MSWILEFTIQNVSIKLEEKKSFAEMYMDLQYKMFLLNSYYNYTSEIVSAFTIQNVSIKSLCKTSFLGAFLYLQYKMFLLN